LDELTKGWSAAVMVIGASRRRRASFNTNILAAITLLALEEKHALLCMRLRGSINHPVR